MGLVLVTGLGLVLGLVPVYWLRLGALLFFGVLYVIMGSIPRVKGFGGFRVR